MFFLRYLVLTVLSFISRLADLMEEHQEELATIEAIDSGAVYTLALKTHVGMSIQTFRYFAGWCDKIQVRRPLRRRHLRSHVSPSCWKCAPQGSTIPINQARPNRNLTFTKKEPIGWENLILGFFHQSSRKQTSNIHIAWKWTCSTLLAPQSVCYCDSLELPADDVGLEDSRVSGCWKHGGPQTCSGLFQTFPERAAKAQWWVFKRLQRNEKAHKPLKGIHLSVCYGFRLVSAL